MSEYVVIYEQAEDGGWGADLQTSPAWSRLGTTRAEVAERIEEAVAAYAEDLRERGHSLRSPDHAAGTVAA